MSSGNFGVQPQSTVYNSRIEVNGNMVGFDSTRRRKSPLNEGFTDKPGNSDPVL
jgi:hypothetical protein